MTPSFRPRFAALVPLACASLSGCDGLLGTPLGPLNGEEGQVLGSDTPAPTSHEGSGDFATGNFDPAVCTGRELHPGHMPGLVRLTHRQYEFAVQDLLGLEAGAQEEFVEDQEFHGFNTNAEQLSVPENQVLRYRATAERLAEQASGDLSKLADHVPCVTAPDAGCRDQFVGGFLKLLFRRPLSAAEQSRYTELFDAGGELYDTGSSFQRGVRVVLEAALQSPNFLYRAEIRDDLPLDGQVVPLSDHEIAARLALTLWSSVPDAALMAKADAGDLHTEAQIETEARRLLEDPKAERIFDDFHAQWLEFHKLRFEKDPITFPDYDQQAFSSAARAETLAFARHVGLGSDGSIAELFSSPQGFVDATLASVYGVSAPSGEGMGLVELDPNERAGLFTQASFLAGHADSLNGSPIHRGAFVQKRVLCTVYGSLPANVGNLPERSADIVTTRDQVEVKTEPPQCQVCHTTINPTGFAFETFDTLGRARTHDNGAEVDATGKLTLDNQEVSYDGPVEFANVLADSPTAQRCYQTQWFRYAYGRGESDDDICLLHQIDQRAAESGHTIKEVLVALTLSRGFRFRAQEEL